MRDLLTYGPGIPRYLALWLPLMPLLGCAFAVGRARRAPAIAIALSTLPTFLIHNPPGWPLAARWAASTGILVTLLAWLMARLRDGGPADRAPGRVSWPAVLGLVGVALVVRVPLAWLDPGIADIPRASETAARQLLTGTNPWTAPNPETVAGTYQYPAGSLLAHLPLVAVAPRELGGEPWVGARATLWVTEAAAVALLAWAGARAGHPRGGLIAAAAYALHPTLARDSGMTVANDLILALCATASAVALARRRPMLAAALAGLAVSVKPVAAVLLPLLLMAAGWRAALLAAAVPVVLQAPFLLLPSPGLHGVTAMLEPVGRIEPGSVLTYSIWAPLYRLLGPTPALLRIVGAAGALGGLAAGAWAGWRLRKGPHSAARVTAAYAVALLVPFLLAFIQRTNYQDWYLTPFLLCAGLAAEPALTSGDAGDRLRRRARAERECNPIATHRR
ncbi:MAG: glycosyltransferase 87 family protein [Egibacteraceae bacterium]